MREREREDGKFLWFLWGVRVESFYYIYLYIYFEREFGLCLDTA